MDIVKGYTKVHKWLYKEYGKAFQCDNSNCLKKSTKFEWAKLKDKAYEQKRENFAQLCKSCHIKLDFTDETRRKMREGKLGKKFRAIPIKQFEKNGNFVAQFESAKEAFRQLKILPSAINNALKGHSQTAGGFKWRYI